MSNNKRLVWISTLAIVAVLGTNFIAGWTIEHSLGVLWHVIEYATLAVALVSTGALFLVVKDIKEKRKRL